jgi:hypothetical protein
MRVHEPAPDGAVSLHTVPVDAFGTVVIVLALVAVVVAAASYWGSGRLYGGLGKGGLGMDHDERPSAAAGPQSAEAQEEIRQMLEAKSARREARGEAPLDVESELASLTSALPEADPELREEVRQLVVARNERRARQGKEPLDVEEEIERQLTELENLGQ